MNNTEFKDLFVLELANNHWGNLDRGIKIIRDFGAIVRHNSVKAAIKLQFRDVDSFIHKDFRNHESRYIQKTIDTKLTDAEYKILVDEVVNVGCIPMATPFDENSVDYLDSFNVPAYKIASFENNHIPLIEKVITKKKPLIISLGATTKREINYLYNFLIRKKFYNSSCRSSKKFPIS